MAPPSDSYRRRRRLFAIAESLRGHGSTQRTGQSSAPHSLHEWRKQQNLSPLQCRHPPARFAKALCGSPRQHQRRSELHFVPRRLALAAALIQNGEPDPALGMLRDLQCGSRRSTCTQNSTTHSSTMLRAAPCWSAVHTLNHPRAHCAAHCHCQPLISSP